MPLAPGTRIGAYEVIAAAGAGAMGEVYRARDTRLERDVALKVLPEAVAADADRRARFEREARTLAALNHPNIAQLHGIEESPAASSGTTIALVMEFVDGLSLDERIDDGPLPLDEVLEIGRQIADALETAHARGIVHRDLKPANVKVSADGTVKVLDFGLAKALVGTDSSDGVPVEGISLTRHSMSQGGVLLGTPAYMAPEQARGRPVDSRADLWSLGVVLFEMVTAKKAFDGESLADVLSAVITREPDWSLLPPTTPPALVRVMRRCLTKDPRSRLQSAGDARIEISDAQVTAPVDAPRVPPPATSRWPKWLAPLGYAAGGAAVAAAAMMLANPATSPRGVGSPPPMRFTVALPPDTAYGDGMAVSPDGRMIVVPLRDASGTSRLWIRPVGAANFRPVAGSEGAGGPFWSPDSREVAFFSRGTLKRLALAGGVARDVAETARILAGSVGAVSHGSTWGDPGGILFGSPRGIHQVDADGGTPVPLTTVDQAEGQRVARWHGLARWLPGHTAFLYTVFEGNDAGVLMKQDRAGGAPARYLGTPNVNAVHLTPDGLLVSHTGSESAATLTAYRVAADGTPEEPGTVLARNVNGTFGASQTGLLVYQDASDLDFHFDWVDPAGRSVGKAFDVSGPGSFNVSRDDGTVLYGEGPDLMLHDLNRGVTSRFLSGPGLSEAVLSPDGREVAYSISQQGRPGIAIRPTTGGADRMVYTAARATLVEDWSSDGRWLAAISRGLGIAIPTDGKGEPVVYSDLGLGSGLDEPRFSPDNRWLTFHSADSGRPEVYVVPFPPTGQRLQISSAGGVQGRWRRDGGALYYLALAGDVMTVEFKTDAGGRPVPGVAQKLFSSGVVPTSNVDQFHVAADGKRFLIRRPKTPRAELQVIVNWPALLTGPRGGPPPPQ